jgi:hypothetical protein
MKCYKQHLQNEITKVQHHNFTTNKSIVQKQNF